MKNSNDTSWDRTCDLLISSTAHVVWVLKIILFNSVYGFFIDAVVFCDDVTQVCGSYWQFVDLL